jgi:hypothetical protein
MVRNMVERPEDQPDFVGQGGVPLGQYLRMPGSADSHELNNIYEDEVLVSLKVEWTDLEARADEAETIALDTIGGSREHREAAKLRRLADAKGQQISQRIVQLGGTI